MINEEECRVDYISSCQRDHAQACDAGPLSTCWRQLLTNQQHALHNKTQERLLPLQHLRTPASGLWLPCMTLQALLCCCCRYP